MSVRNAKVGWVLGLLALASVGACHTVPQAADSSGCQDISGIVGREFRLSLVGFLKAPTTEGGGGLFGGLTFPEISREFRESLVMGDQLCRAAAMGLINPELYERFVTAQLDSLGALAVQTGARKPDQVQSARAMVAKEIVAAGGPGMAAVLNAADIAKAGPLSPKPFASARAVFNEVNAELPPPRADSGLDADYAALGAMIAELRSQLVELDRRLPPVPRPYQPAGHVLFDKNASTLNNAALETLKEIVAKQGSEAAYSLEGFADQSGDFARNLDLSSQRAARVAEALRALGVRGPITVAAVGRTNAFGDEAGLNRRVQIGWRPAR